MRILLPNSSTGVSNLVRAIFFIGLLPLLLIVILVYLLWGMLLYLAIWLTHPRELVIFVYSDSPIWKGYLERDILPLIRERAILLNWSEQRSWKSSLPVLAFNYFAGARDFNPIGIVLRPFHFAKIYRFYKAFQEFKHGDARSVEAMKDQFFMMLSIESK